MANIKGNILIVCLFLLVLTSCKKELAKLKGETCWKCQVKGWPDAPNPNDKDYTTTICNDGEYPTNIHDDYGNELNHTCDKQ